MKRRTLLQTAAGTLLPGVMHGAAEANGDLRGEIGLTTGSFMKHLTAGTLRLLDLPKIMRDELGMKVMDLMTATLASTEPAYLEQLRKAAAEAGCILTNLKMNNPGLDMASADAATRRHAIDEYKRTIDAAALLGVRWVRPLPGKTRPDLKLVAESCRELMDHAAPKGISLLVENFGWMQDDPQALPQIIAAVPGLKVQPDTGNWTTTARYEGLQNAFPHAVSCDFKFFELDAQGEHARYDLRRCFDIGWQAGFRGPWCFEHFHTDLQPLLKEMLLMKGRLQEWRKAA